jgi:hypothetical protein
MGGGDEFRYFIASVKVFESNTLPTYSFLLENRVFGDVSLCRCVGQVLSLMRSAFTSTALAPVLCIRAKLADKTWTSSQKLKFLSLHLPLFTCHLLSVQFVTSQTSNLCTALIVRNATENNTVNSKSQDTTALHPKCICNRNTSVTGHNIERFDVPTRNLQDTTALQPIVFVTGIRRLLTLTSNDLASLPGTHKTQLHFSPMYL